MKFQIGQRVEYVGCPAYNWLARGSRGVVTAAHLGGMQYSVSWEENPVPPEKDAPFCWPCLKPLDDPKPQDTEAFAESIGWKLPTKEPA